MEPMRDTNVKRALLARLYGELEQQIDHVHHHYDAALVTAHSRAVLDLARAIAILEGKPEPERVDVVNTAFPEHGTEGVPTYRLPVVMNETAVHVQPKEDDTEGAGA